MNFKVFVVTNVNKKHYQNSTEGLTNAYHANKGGHMAERSLKDLVAEAINEVITDGKLQIQDLNGDKIEDLEIAYVEDEVEDELEDDSDDSEDDSEEDSEE